MPIKINLFKKKKLAKNYNKFWNTALVKCAAAGLCCVAVAVAVYY